MFARLVVLVPQKATLFKMSSRFIPISGITGSQYLSGLPFLLLDYFPLPTTCIAGQRGHEKQNEITGVYFHPVRPALMKKRKKLNEYAII